jgi:cell wall-associated NlpC family hydrolase
MCCLDEIAAERARAIAVAETWLGTPWHHEARVKGHGVDCAQILIAVYAEAGLIPDFKTAPYPADWHLHRETPLFVQHVLEHAVEVRGAPLPGDMVLFRFGRQFSHGSIVTGWPMVIHAPTFGRVTREDMSKARKYQFIGERGPDQGRPRPRKTYRLLRWTLAGEQVPLAGNPTPAQLALQRALCAPCAAKRAARA